MVIGKNLYFQVGEQNLFLLLLINTFFMEENDKQGNEEKFSDDPEENLRIENEILKLKMQAESGAYFSENTNADLPPEIENEFLRQIQHFEEAWKDVKYTKVYDIAGKPYFKKAYELLPDEIEKELQALFELLDKHNINLHVQGEYEPLDRKSVV